MKKLFMLFLLFAVNSNALDFSPTPMTITVPAQIEYKFDDSYLEIPFTLTGKSGAVWLVINTHGQAENINAVRNGHLGWHYVNKIDTTIYISDRFERDQGENTLIWDGKDENGNIPEPGSYDYYLWGYDDKSEKQAVSEFVRIGFHDTEQFTKIYENDEDGLPLSHPVMFGNIMSIDYDDNIQYKRHGTHFKWIIGSNPNDSNMLQTTLCRMYYPLDDWDTTKIDWIGYGGPVLDPNDLNVFYHTSFKNVEKINEIGKPYNQKYSTILKWEFVTAGEAFLDGTWLGFNRVIWTENFGYRPYFRSSCYSDNNFIYVGGLGHMYPWEWNKLRCVSFDGDVIFDKMMHGWYMPDEWDISGQDNCSIEKIYSWGDNRLYILSTQCCLHTMINTSRLLEDPDDETDMVIFENRNGDYFLDNGSENKLHPWYCIAENQLGVPARGIYNDSVSIDSNGFNVINTSYLGITSFAVLSQDGTGIDYMSFSDETTLSKKGGGQLVDSGSNYDGLYVNSIKTRIGDWYVWDNGQTYYVAFDSAHGMITNNPAVEEQNPVQFKVAQNTPNPFNPSTTILFSIPESGNVFVEIYNVMGQKVKTLTNGPMSAGEHSVKWDASGFSAGVYFYKVKAGKFEKIMRMTLVK